MDGGNTRVLPGFFRMQREGFDIMATKFKNGDRVTIDGDKCGEVTAAGPDNTYTVECDDGSTVTCEESQLAAE